MSLKRSNPAFSIGRASRKTHHLRQVSPGPQQYHPTVVAQKRVKGGSFTQSRRYKSKLVQDSPGPQDYEVSRFKKSFEKGPTIIFTTAPRGNTRTETSPGPQAYTIQPSLSSTAGFSIGAGPRSTSRSRENSPGPGAYDTTRHLKLKKGCKIGTSQKFKEQLKKFREDLQRPGPQSYFIQSTMCKSSVNPRKNAPAYVIANRHGNFQRKSQQTPGPMEYQIVKEFGTEAPQVVIPKSKRQALNIGERATTPGPLEYHPQPVKTMKACPSYSIGTSQRPSSSPFSSSQPGPQTYSTESLEKLYHTPAFPFSTAKRDNSMEGKRSCSTSPGPQTYVTTQSSLGGPAFVIGKKLSKQMKEYQEIPGVGTYTPLPEKTSRIKKQPGVIFNTSKRKGPAHDTLQTPAPNSYQPLIVAKNVPRAIFSRGSGRQLSQRVLQTEMSPRLRKTRSQLKVKKSDQPGPGQYKIPVSFANLPTYAQASLKSPYKYV